MAQRVEQVMAQMSEGEELDLVSGSGGTPIGLHVGNTPALAQLCIPALGFEDGPQGPGEGNGNVTQLPSPVSAAATWDTSLEQQYGTVVGNEQAATGANVDLGPTINIVRDPRWGRASETFGEDPYLTGQLAGAFVQGVQSQGVMAQVKHYAVYNQETTRNTALDSDMVNERAMQEIYLPGFQAAVNAGDESIMCAYSFPNGVPACQNGYLLGVLNNQMNFAGYVVSDWSATHSTVPAALAGEDIDMPGGDPLFAANLYQAVDGGQLPRAYLDDMVQRILTEMFNDGLFNGYPTGSFTNSAHRATATQVAEEGTVLLKNTGNLLPLNPTTVGSIAVIGTDASTNPIYSGNGSTGVVPNNPVTPLQGIQAAVGSGVTVTYDDGTNQSSAVAAAQAAKVAVIFADYTEGEGADITSIDLGTTEDNLISAVSAANPNTIVVLNTGSAVTMPWLSSVPSVLEAWYPGEVDGTAAAAVLFGSANPSGHLPVTFPTSLSQVPASTPQEWTGQNGQVDYNEGIDVGYRWYQAQGETPLFPFGYGLSYTTFRYSNLSVTGFNSSGVATVTATVTNTGTVSGSDVAQLYIGDPPSTGEPPWQLKGFQRVTLTPNQATTVTFSVPVHDLTYWGGPGANTNPTAWNGNDGGGWEAPAGTYNIGVGDSSANFPLTGTLNLASPVGPDTVTVSNPGNQTTTAGSTVNVAIGATDSASGQTLTYTATGLPGGLNINPSTGVISGTALHTGTDTVIVTVTDGEAWEGSTSFTWTVTGTNVGPTVLPGSVTGPGNLCLTDTNNGISQTGNAIAVATCNGGLPQIVTYAPDGTLQMEGGCIEPAGGAGTSGTAVQYYPCSGASAQVWSHPGNGELVDSATGLCLDDPGANTTSGTDVVTDTCTGAPEQVWDVAPGSDAGPGQLGAVVGDAGLCVDLQNGATNPGQPVDANTCNGTAAQEWLNPGNNTLQVSGGCLNATGTSSGSTIDYETCNGSTVQGWVHQSNGEYTNSASGLCMAIPGGNTAPGAVQLDVETCTDAVSQQWTVPGGAPGTNETSTTIVPTTVTSLPTTTTDVPGSNCAASVSGTALNRTGWVATSNTTQSAADAPANALDGNLATRFSTDSGQTAGMELEVDMGSQQNFNELDLDSTDNAGDYARGFDVYVSADGNSWTPVASCTGTASPEIVSFSAQTARYIEILLTVNYPSAWWSVDELNVYGNGSGGTTTSTTTTTVLSGTTTTTAATTTTTAPTGANCSASASGSELSQSGWTASTNAPSSGGDVPAN
ncbi:MAG TPA: glycoside hydrolase family 3 C-terminal domain-containing protein, partial [Acidimicrobiales bacterium]|nr:glycoside hydrolase family 3 C-terminal domain-containing protein [Acidimicrobiales bacterium]